MAVVQEKPLLLASTIFLFLVNYAMPTPVDTGADLTLEDYVNRPDPTYAYYEVNRTEDHNHTTYYLNMTSQKWMDENFSDRPVWWHDMVISVPRKIAVSDVAFLFIGSGHNAARRSPTPESEDDFITAAIQRMSLDAGIVTSFIKQIPNQPIVLKDDPTEKSRVEDEIIANLWRSFIENENVTAEILLRYPMTKAVVRAMDTVTEFMSKISAKTNITKFVVAGLSKRGWTTWTTAAVDKRVIAQMPIEMSLLDFYKNMQKHQSSLGGWTFEYSDYYSENITRNLAHPRLAKAMELVNPYSFIDKYTMPTMILGGTSDQFFLLDDSHLFFSQLPGPKYIQMMPNRDHSLHPFDDVTVAMTTFTIGVTTGYQFPQITWQLFERENGGQIVLNSSHVKPTFVSSWYAVTNNALRRDFRAYYLNNATVKKSNVFWFQHTVTNKGDSIFVAEYEKQDNGWLGFLIQAEYEGPSGHPLTLTTEVNVIPNTFPYPPCRAEGCYETLV